MKRRRIKDFVSTRNKKNTVYGFQTLTCPFLPFAPASVCHTQESHSMVAIAPRMIGGVSHAPAIPVRFSSDPQVVQAQPVQSWQRLVYPLSCKSSGFLA